MNGEQVINNFDQWYPVSLENFDKQVKLNTSDSVYVFRTVIDNGQQYITRNVGIWSFVIVFDNIDDAISYKQEHNIDCDISKTAAIDVVHDFRSWYFNGVPMFISALEDYLCTSIVTHLDGPLYPSCTSLLLVAIKVSAWAQGRLECITKSIDEINAVVTASNPYDMIVEVSKFPEWNAMKYAIAYIPLQVLMTQYDYIVIKNNAYELKIAAALSAQSLSLMSDEYIDALRRGENDAI